MPLSSSWLLCPPTCKSQLLGQSQGETQGRSAKALCPTKRVRVFLERNPPWDISTSVSWQLQHREAPGLWSHFTRGPLDLLRTKTDKPVFFMPTAQRREWFCLASTLPPSQPIRRKGKAVSGGEIAHPGNTGLTLLPKVFSILQYHMPLKERTQRNPVMFSKVNPEKGVEFNINYWNGRREEKVSKAESLLPTMISSCFSVSNYSSVHPAADTDIHQYHPLAAKTKLLPAWRYTYPAAS